MIWSEESILRLRELWDQGLSTVEIGRRLGVSQNAVIGKAHRLDLTARPSPIRREPSEKAPSQAPTRRAKGGELKGATLPPLSSTNDQPSIEELAASSTTIEPVTVVPEPPAVTIPTAPEPAPSAQPIVAESLAEPVSSTQRQAESLLTSTPKPTELRSAIPAARRPKTPCQWPIGEPGKKDFRFCDDASIPGKSYCVEHVKLAYVKFQDRREDAA